MQSLFFLPHTLRVAVKRSAQTGNMLDTLA
jgi:hypothetical protein